jgi:micrococcal nuclease
VTVRLHGIDAPEVAQPGGRDAVAALAALVDGKQTVCTGTKRDDYNRLIATCNAASGDVGAQLIQQGRAWAYVKYSSGYLDQEQAARRGRLGRHA